YDRLRQEGALDEKAARAVTSVFHEVLESELVRKGELTAASDKIQLEIENVRLQIEKVRAEVEKVRADLTKEIGNIHREIETIRLEMENIRAEVEKLRADTNKEIEMLKLQVKSELDRNKTEILKWLIGLLIAQTSLLIGILRFAGKI
ncbi:MAG: CCDC90 family protein, partial [Leptospiraceae bacterium]|nr:CCDC90 family protein [Leptospiraceae bacterium]